MTLLFITGHCRKLKLQHYLDWDRVVNKIIFFSTMRGYFGFVSVQPKTRLIDLYQNKYGFRQYGRLLAIEQEASRFLINNYLDYDDEE